MSFFLIFLSAMLVNNILLMRFLGLCPFFGISSSLKASVGMGFAVVFVMVLSTGVSWLVYQVLEFYHMEYLRTAVFILSIAAFVQLVEMFIRKVLPPLYLALGIYLPLITTNCAVLGAAFLANDYKLDFFRSEMYTLGVSVGFFLAIVLFAGIREVVDHAPISKSFKGQPIAFITASLMSLAFMGFKGLFGL
ncbi:MAG: RnfABCDGE type electron transport complex subunit A [Spirochaetales bacterium]|nr:RnfABCDGE type electron transport complex subunit A [Spirochaetales bacterium]